MPASDRLSWFSDPRQWFRAVLMLDDSPHHIALGAAIGVFIALTPTVGIQMLIVMLVALLAQRWFRFNKMAALLMVYISNPLTVVPLYWFAYKLGTVYFPGTVSRREFERILQYDGFAEWWNSITRLFVDVGLPLVAGSLILATCCALPTYPVLLRVIQNLRRAEREARRAAKAARKHEHESRRSSEGGPPAMTSFSRIEADPCPIDLARSIGLPQARLDDLARRDVPVSR
jgi:uncharacterized protein